MLEEGFEAKRDALKMEVASRIGKAFSRKDWPLVIALAEGVADPEDFSADLSAAIGFAYFRTNQWEPAVRFLREAWRKGLHPTVDFYRCLGKAEEELSHFVKAYACYCRAQRTAAGSEGVGRESLMDIVSHRAFLAGHLGRMDRYAVIDREECLPKACGLAERQRIYSRWLFTMHCLENDADELFRQHLGFAELFRGVQPYGHVPRKKRKLRIGYLSPDFHHHSVFRLLFALVTLYDRERYELCGYYTGKKHDDCTAYIKNAMTVWRELADCPFEEMAEQIHGDGVDILVELAGHTPSSGLPVLAWKPAPIQVTALGYLSTTGLPAVDYIITDRFIDPPEQMGARLAEFPVRLSSQWCYAGIEAALSMGAPSREKGFLTLGCFNQYAKMTDRMLLLWRDILKELPGARLLIKAMAFEHEGTLRFAEKRLERLGLPMERVDLEVGSMETDYMKRYLDVDIALDTYPYVGGLTTCDALYMGVPVISLYGERRGSRFGLSILQNVGLGELAVPSFEEYKERVLGLARDPELLDLLHRNLRGMMRRSPLMDMGNYVREWENFFEQAMKARWGEEE